MLLAEPRGFCAGVDRAIEIVERELVRFGAPVYVRHEIVHNTYVVEDLKAKGAIFIEDLADVPELRLVPGRLPVTALLEAKLTAPKARAVPERRKT